MRKLSAPALEKLRAYEAASKAEDSYNFMYLSSSGRSLCCNLLEFQIQCENQREVLSHPARPTAGVDDPDIEVEGAHLR